MVRADIGSFSEELDEGIRLDVCSTSAFLGLLDPFGLEGEIGAVEVSEGVGRLVSPSSTSFEPYTPLKGDSLLALAAWAFIFLESGVLAKFDLGIEVCSQI